MTTLFNKEDRILKQYRAIIETTEHEGHPLVHDLTALLSHYEELLSKFDRLTKVSDKQQISLHEMARVDGLTGLNNRKYLEDFLKFEWKRASDLDVPMAMIMVDIDYFKLYNDTYGHQAGDRCLKQVGEVLAQTVKRSSDFVARYGGEEFTIVLTDCRHHYAVDLAEKIQRAISTAEIRHAGSKVSEYVTLSMGIAVYQPGKGSSPSALLSAADEALYRAKESGRNRFHLGRID
ncbi:signal transduction diguanylate cyclase [Oleiphilus messinensis]|uniref:diguanylate cyclase n=1 Tax=Oleiphilus messinensis TaxID=141451 RepID=A0A1Y0IG44_9GAMM|nr:diguanylate cyclase [Oleiphilus messinensis]ARU59220.1 signal transduction diguanylate cyclase [Oleiphilus messinensis]